MADITTRAGKGSPLTNAELDSNFTNLNTDKLEPTSLTVETNPASGGGSLTYSNTVFTFTPADVSGGGGGSSFQPMKLDPITVVNGQSDYTMQMGGVNHDPASDFALLVSLNGVIQAAGDAFNTVGSTITFIPALQTGDVIDFIIDLGNAVDVTEVMSTDTLDDVTTRGNATTNGIAVGSIEVNGEVVELTRNATLSGNQALDPALGTIQRIVMSGNITFTDSLADGEAITLMIDDGTGRTITWPAIAWIGGSAPTLDTANLSVIQVWKINGSLYGASVGVAS